MEQTDIHFRAGGKITHCGVECLPGGRDIERIVIDHIEFKDSETINGRVENGVWIAHFAPNPYTQLPLILNVTNRKRLVKLFPECEGYPARLHGVAVRLTKEKTRDPQEGGECWGLRISRIPASPEPEPKAAKKKPLTLDKVDSAVKWMKENGKTLDDVKKKYDVPQDVEDAIITAFGPQPDMGDLPE